MGSSRTPKYVVIISTPGYSNSPAGWDVRGRYGLAGCGQPTDANLAKYVAAYNASAQTGGHNQHLNQPGKPWRIVRAAVYLNDGRYANPLATWEAPAFELGA